MCRLSDLPGIPGASRARCGAGFSQVERVVEVAPRIAPGAKAEAVATAEAMRAERNMLLM
jgi:hypothetical protein